MKKVEFETIESNCIAKLQEEIFERINEGWIASGKIRIIHHSFGKMVFMQKLKRRFVK